MYMPNVKPGLAAVWVNELSAVHPVIAQDMECVTKQWRKCGEALAEEETRLDTTRDKFDCMREYVWSWKTVFAGEKVNHGTVLANYSRHPRGGPICCEQQAIKWREEIDDDLREEVPQ